MGAVRFQAFLSRYSLTLRTSLPTGKRGWVSRWYERNSID